MPSSLRPWPLAAWIGAAVLLASCGGGGDSGPRAPWYEADASQLQREWLTQRQGSSYCEPLLPGPSGGADAAAMSQGPWWLDGNHAPPGAGYLFLIAFAYHRDWSIDGVIAPTSTRRSTDLRGASLRVRWRAPELRLPPGASVSFWFQARGEMIMAPQREMVNYLQVRTPLATAANIPSAWREDVVHLAPRADDYLCLGSNPDRTDLYGCRRGPVEALADWDTDLGIVIHMPELAMAEQVSGSVEISSIRIDLDEAVAAQVWEIPPPQGSAISSCRHPA